MKSKLISCTTFALLLLLAGVAGAAEPAAAPVPAPTELTLLADQPSPACGRASTAASDPLAELLQSFTASVGNPEPQLKACVASYGGCQCYGSCTSSGCFCSSDSCCSACCSRYRSQCC
jgi:hypothetical protein